jgi:hypothetical protein
VKFWVEDYAGANEA